MPIVVSRIDDRLIHGQVATSWIGSNNVQVVVVVDDAVAADPIQVSVLKLAAPSGVRAYAQSVEKFVEKWKAGILDGYNVMLVFANVFAPKKLIESGVPITSLNVGGMRFTPERKQVEKAISLTADEAAAFHTLIDAGVEVEHRQRFTDVKKPMAAILADAGM